LENRGGWLASRIKGTVGAKIEGLKLETPPESFGKRGEAEGEERGLKKNSDGSTGSLRKKMRYPGAKRSEGEKREKR